jgi:Ca-activated chloride channel family protein
MNRDGDINGSQVELRLNQVLRNQEKFALIEVELPAGRNGQNLQLANATITYRDVSRKQNSRNQGTVSIRYTDNASVALASRLTTVKEDVVLQTATERSEAAMQLRDQGKIKEAAELLELNADELEKAAADLNSPKAGAYAQTNRANSLGVEADEEAWNRTRKEMVDDQYQLQSQQSY